MQGRMVHEGAWEYYGYARIACTSLRGHADVQEHTQR
jgi:hypothetical protein